MYVIYEESGAFKLGTVIKESDSSLQIQTAHGKQAKIKRTHAILFANDAPSQLLEQAQSLANEIDIPFLWEVAPKEIFSIETLAKEYFGEQSTLLEKTSLLVAVHQAPTYFHRQGKGSYRAAPPEILRAALMAIEKKRLQQAQIEQWAEDMLNGIVHDNIRLQAESFLEQPNKNTPEWKAFDLAMTRSGKTVADLLITLKIYPNELALRRSQFFKQAFPHGTSIDAKPIPKLPELPQSEVKAYSVDDAHTIEIDDAFSVTPLGEGIFQFGIHIACPALVVTKGSELDRIAAERLSTAYLPSEKIFMQQDNLIERFSLFEGDYRPALSLYINANIHTGELLAHDTKLEKVWIEKNLRTNDITTTLSKEVLEAEDSSFPYREIFKPIWQLSKHLQKQRELIRGMPENNDRVEFNVALEGSVTDMQSKVHLIPRRRNAPIELMVAEMMILANTTWAKWLKSLNLPAIYRNQENGRTRTSTYPNPHEGIGVECYAWCTSPLRRYVDLINQQQLICAAEHHISARLVAPYQHPKELHGIIYEFDQKYNLLASGQNEFERFWTLRFLQQNDIHTLTAQITKDKWVRCTHIPLNLAVQSIPAHLKRGDYVQLGIDHIDLLNLTLNTHYIQTIDPVELP